MNYIDRKGNITIEENRQDRLLHFLYNDRGGRLCLKLLVRPFISKAAGVFLNSPLSAGMVPVFVEKNHIDLSVYTKQRFRSYNDFFTRKIKPGRAFFPPQLFLVCSYNSVLNLYKSIDKVLKWSYDRIMKSEEKRWYER